MSTSLSMAEILARLEARIAHHEQQVALHQQQEPLLELARLSRRRLSRVHLLPP